MKTLRILVQPTEKCVELLRYIERQIDKINSAGIKVAIERVGPSDTGALKKTGVDRLPAVVGDKSEVYVGFDQICSMFESEIQFTSNLAARERSGDRPAEEISTRRYWEVELFDENGDPRKDDEDDEAASFEREIASARNVRRPPAANRNQGPIPGDNDEEPPAAEEKANVDHGTRSKKQERPIKQSRRAADKKMSGGDMDKMMLEAWLENNGQEK